MRKFLFFPALFLCSVAFAGQEDNFNSNIGPLATGTPGIGGIFPHFSPSASAGSNVPTKNLRLIGKVYSQYGEASFVAVDSTTYRYGLHRGSTPDPDNINSDDHILFDQSTNYRFNASTGSFEYNKLREQSFHNNKVSELVYKRWDDDNAIWQNNERYRYSYDDMGKMSYSVFDLWGGTLWTNQMPSSLLYTGNNVSQIAGVDYKADFRYDNNGNLTQMEDQSRDLSNAWTKNEKKSYTYDAKNNVTSYTLEKWNNGWMNAMRWEYTYDANDNIVKKQEYSWSTGTWLSAYQYSYTYDNNNNKLEEIKNVWDVATSTFVASKKEVITYNDGSLPEQIITYTWINQRWVSAYGDIAIRYYYEQYDPTNIPQQFFTGNLSVYPIPARDNINVNINWETPTRFHVALVDITGKLIYQKNEEPTMNYKSSIAVNNLPAGHYALVVNDGNTTITKKVVIN